MIGLTPNQRDLMRIIQELADAEGGAMPSLSELAVEMDSGQRGNIHFLLCQLRERGYLRWSPRRARSLEILLRVPKPAEEPEFVGTFEAPALFGAAS